MAAVTGIKKLVNLGVEAGDSTLETGKTRIVNLVGLISIVIIVAAALITIGFKSYHYLVFNAVFLVLFFLPIYLNARHQLIGARVILVFLVLTAILFSSITIGYQSFFKYTIIIPILLSSIFFEDAEKWILALVHSAILIFILTFETAYFLEATDMGRSIHQDVVFNILGYLVIIACFFLLLKMVMDNLTHSNKELVVYKRIFEYSREGIAVFNKDVEYLHQNKAHQEIMGFSSDELAGRTPEFHMGVEVFQQIGGQILESGTYHGEVVSKTKYGSRYIDLLVFMVPISKEEFYLVGIKRDITDRKKVELQLIRNDQELKQALASKDRFFSIIAHDLKSPFNSLIGFSDLLLEEGSDYSPEDTTRYLTHINQLSVQTLMMLENLLEWSQMESGRLEVKPVRISVKDLFLHTVEEMRNIAAQKKIRIVTEIADDLWCLADKRMMQVVIRNLVSNAVKFSHPEGRIYLSGTLEGSQVVLKIRDEGTGIPAEQLDRIFDPHHQVSQPGTGNEKGSGLGLVLCREFVEKNKGRLQVESEPGQGSVFSVLLPQK